MGVEDKSKGWNGPNIIKFPFSKQNRCKMDLLRWIVNV